MSPSLERLHALLVEDKERQRNEREDKAKRTASLGPILAKVEKVWDATLLPSKTALVRPITSDLYQCPLSKPQTILAPWNSLPRSIQSKLNPLNNRNDSKNALVEVPKSLLVNTNDEEATGKTETSLQRRPLGGNLTNKLKEYTRGASGQVRPFRPGGMDDEIQRDGGCFMSPHEIHKSQQVLDKGSEISWKEGNIICAPPGVDFKIVLNWNSVYDMNVNHGGETNDPREETVDELGISSINNNKISRPEAIIQDYRPATMSKMWERSFLEDDSLFGDSSNDGSDDDDKSEDPTEEPKNYVTPLFESKPKAAEIVVSPQVDEIDELLAQLLISDEPRARKASRGIVNNPLELAKEHAEMAQDTGRKSWADTQLLHIGDFNTLIPNPAMTFPFTLDDFQQQAIARLERSESIFVAAHTSAGKTVCAEYAVALCRQHRTRAIYTSPIKALSNQKFRDFCKKFGSENVGLVTGDLQLNVDDSTCLIMTTEILRSMLYRGADLIRDIEWVIFDEVHYVNDSERGVVWEEVIIMLPQYVNLIFLSATTPNTIEFSDWIGRTKRKKVHVIRTNYRPVPLSHFLWAGLKLHKIMEGKGGFLDKGYKEASQALQPQKVSKDKDNDKCKGKSSGGSRPVTGSKHLAWQQQGNKNNWISLIRFLDREGLTPIVTFSFSKKKCEEIADMLRSLDLNTSAERSAVQGFTIQTIARLSPNDATLPQVQTVCEMVQRGIGIHHGGLLPILKEMVEILFSRTLIKVLFATETFAMGVNMPARVVVFNSTRKHDGVNFRELEPGEYTQMAGRAGRRGLDKVGTVIVCCFGEVPPPLPILRTMLTGSSTRLKSNFRLTYNMILNLLRVEDMSVEGMIKRSFSEFATQRALTANAYPQLLARGEKTLVTLENQFKEEAGNRVGADDIEDYFAVCSELLATNEELFSFIIDSVGVNGGGAFVPGRVLLVTAARKRGYVRTPAMVLKPPVMSGGYTDGVGAKSVICLVLLPESYVVLPATGHDATRKPGTVDFVGVCKRRHFAIHDLSLREVLLVSSSKYKIDTSIILKEDTNDVMTAKFGTRGNSFGGFLPAGKGRGDDFCGAFVGLKPRGKKGDKEEDFFGSSIKKANNDSEMIEEIMGLLIEAEKTEAASGLKPLDLRDCVQQGSDILKFRQRCGNIYELVTRMRSFSSHLHPAIEAHYTSLERKETLRTRVSTLRHLLSNESLQLFPDFLQRKSVLKTLGYVDENETVCVKGRVACEVNTCEELIVTEMIFEGVLNDLEPAEIVAALSSLVYQAKGNGDEFDSELPERLVICCNRMKMIATNIGQLQKEHGLDVDPGEYCDNCLKFGLVHVVYEWALGVMFSNICELTDAQEGSIVRCITRLDELCREVRNCARVVGNPTLYRKMEAASMAIKRDIVFASSLYIT